MNNSHSTLLLNNCNNKTVIYKDAKHLKLHSYNETQLKEIFPQTATKKGEIQKKLNSLICEDKSLNQNSFKGKNSQNVVNPLNFSTNFSNKINKTFNTDTKEIKGSFLRDLELDSVQRSQLSESKSSLDRSGIVKVYEELAEMKLQNNKLQIEIKGLKENVQTLKQNLSQKMQEINLLNSKHKEIVDKYYIDSEENKTLKKENFVLKDNLTKATFIFKSTLSVMVELLDSFVFKPLNDTKNFSLKNNVFDNSGEALKAYNAAAERSEIVSEIQKIMINNLTYANKALNLDLAPEIERIKEYNIKPPKNPLNNNNSFRFSFYNDENSKTNSPKFLNEKLVFDEVYLNTFNNNMIEEDSFPTNVNTNDKEKIEEIGLGGSSNLIVNQDENFHRKIELNDKVTDFNFEFLDEEGFEIKNEQNSNTVI